MAKRKNKDVLTTGDVAKICHVAPRTASKWFDEGQLKGYRLPGRKDRRIPPDELNKFMKEHNMSATIPTTTVTTGNARILIVSNNEPAVSDLVNALTRANYEVRQARSVFETGKVCQQFMPQVLLVNFLDKNINAREISESIRADADFQNTKLIAITGELSDSESAALLQQGFDAFVSNRADIAEIIGKIREGNHSYYLEK